MNRAVEIFKIIAAVADHWPREGRPGFFGNLDWPGSEKLVVRLH